MDRRLNVRRNIKVMNFDSILLNLLVNSLVQNDPIVQSGEHNATSTEKKKVSRFKVYL